jgi:hypothetical protein
MYGQGAFPVSLGRCASPIVTVRPIGNTVELANHIGQQVYTGLITESSPDLLREKGRNSGERCGNATYSDGNNHFRTSRPNASLGAATKQIQPR